MSCQTVEDFCVAVGATFEATFRWASDVLISKSITGITRAAPAVVTAVAHGFPAGWPVAVASAGGMTQINTKHYPPRTSDLTPAIGVSTDTVSLGDINSTEYTAYTSGGFLVGYTPADLSVVSAATFIVYDNADFTGTPLKSLAIGTGVTLSNTLKTIFVTFQTAGLSWSTGYYQLLLTVPTARVIELAAGVITIEG
jgi:hypothetical protein